MIKGQAYTNTESHTALLTLQSTKTRTVRLVTPLDAEVLLHNVKGSCRAGGNILTKSYHVKRCTHTVDICF